MKSLHWDITNKCNLRCRHCYNADKYFNQNAVDYSATELSLEKALEIVEMIAQNGFDRIHLLGGEPLASKSLIPVISKAKELGLLVTINSNATLLTSEMQKQLIDLKIDHFAASLDGTTATTNDSIRGNGTFKIVCDNMREFNERIRKNNSKIQTGIVSTITKANYSEIINLPNIAKDIGCNLIVLTAFMESGNGAKSKETFEASDKILLDAIENMLSTELINENDLYLQLDLRPLVIEYLHSKYDAKILYNINNSLCCAGEDIWYLEADGNVHPCLVYRLKPGIKAQQNDIFKAEKLKLGEVGIEKVQKSKYWKDFLYYIHGFKHENVETCKECNYQNVCLPCPFEFMEDNNNCCECEWVMDKIADDIRKYKKMKLFVNEKTTISAGAIYIDGNHVFNVDEMVLYILKLIKECKRFDDIVSEILKEYEVERGKVEKDVVNVLNYLCSRKVIICN